MNWKAIIALVVVLAGSLGTWAALRGRTPDGTAIDPPGLDRVFPTLRSDDVQALSLLWRDDAGTETATTFTRAGSGWSVQAGALQDEGDPQNIDKVLNGFIKLRQQRAVPPEPHADYGFAPADVELRATLTDGRDVAVLIGKVAWQDTLRYLQVAGDPEVRVVPAELYGHCRRPVDWFRNHDILTIPGFETQTATITTPQGTMTLKRVSRGWVQTAPVADQASLKIVEDFLQRLNVDAKARRFVDQVAPADYPTYGLDQPFLDVTVTGDKGASCRVRYSEGEGTYAGKPVRSLYALRDGRVFECGPDHLAQLRIRDLKYFRSIDLVTTDSQRLNLLKVTAPGRPDWAIVRQGATWSLALPRKLLVNGDLVRLLPDIAGQLEVERFFDHATPADWALFGVDDANGIRVKLTDDTGNHSDLVIGNVVPDTRDTLRYVRLVDGDRVRAMTARTADYLTGAGRGWLFYLAKQLWNVGTPSVTNLRIEHRADGTTHLGDWAVTSGDGTAAFTAGTACSPAAAAQPPDALQNALSSLATLYALHWVQDGHTDLERFGLGEAQWRMKVTLTVVGADGPEQRELFLGADVMWPSFKGDPQQEMYARTGAGQALSGDMILTLRPSVLEALRTLVK